jgi:outer membrane lipoprotein carrier protein
MVKTMRAGFTSLLPGAFLAAALAAAPATHGRAAALTAGEVADAVQHRYDSVKDFSSDFVQVYQSGALKKQMAPERGRLLIKKPGRMRWEYTSPEHKLFVSDGLKMYSYVEADKQVFVDPVPADDNPATPSMFLAGKGNLTRDFTVSLVDAAPGMPAGTVALKLVPKKPQPDYDWLALEVEAGTYHLRGLVTPDSQGGTSTFTFPNLKENVGLADKDFEFKPPRGVDMVNDASRR